MELFGYFIDQVFTVYEIEIILEEWLEMIGASLILCAASSSKQALEAEPMAENPKHQRSSQQVEATPTCFEKLV
jgi:hypothetical protein